MAVLFRKETAARLLALLDQRAPSRSALLSADAVRPRPAETSAYPDPFEVRYSAAAESWLICLPPRCVAFPEDADVAVSLESAGDDLPHWYLLDVTATGVVFVWVEPAEGAPDAWWGSWSTAALSAGTELPDGAASAGAFLPVAYVDVDTYRIRQYASGTLRLASAPADLNSVEIGYDDNGYPLTQLRGFTDADVTAAGLSECIEVDPESGAVSAKSAGDKYQLVVRVTSSGGNVIGYMPLGTGDGDDPEPADPNAGEDGTACGVGNFPGKTGHEGDGEDNKSGLDNSYWPSALEPDLGGGAGTDGNAFPGKQNDCW